jgi:hypothetical protein
MAGEGGGFAVTGETAVVHFEKRATPFGPTQLRVRERAVAPAMNDDARSEGHERLSKQGIERDAACEQDAVDEDELGGAHQRGVERAPVVLRDAA